MEQMIIKFASNVISLGKNYLNNYLFIYYFLIVLTAMETPKINAFLVHRQIIDIWMELVVYVKVAM